jgi:hypothetical protein
MHFKSFNTQQHCNVSPKTLCPGGIRTRVLSFLMQMWCPLRNTARAILGNCLTNSSGHPAPKRRGQLFIIGANFQGQYYEHSFFVARNFWILHHIIEDAESWQIWHFATMPGVEHCNINYNVSCSRTPYCYIGICIFKPSFINLTYQQYGVYNEHCLRRNFGRKTFAFFLKTNPLSMIK